MARRQPVVLMDSIERTGALFSQVCTLIVDLEDLGFWLEAVATASSECSQETYSAQPSCCDNISRIARSSISLSQVEQRFEHSPSRHERPSTAWHDSQTGRGPGGHDPST
jgi:hypothetical protein